MDKQDKILTVVAVLFAMSLLSGCVTTSESGRLTSPHRDNGIMRGKDYRD